MPGDIYFKKAGRHVEAHGRESVLETGLKAGIPLKYRCSNGNCGECRAYLLDGKLIQTRHHDFVLSEAEKTEHAFLMCSNCPDGDVTIMADNVGRAEDIPLQNIEARLKSVKPIDDQVCLLHVRTPRSDRLQFLAGQSVKLGGNEDVPLGCYPIASCPCDDMNLYFHIPLIPGEPFSEFIFSDAVKNCKRIDITGPEGDFVYNTHSTRIPVFVVWHTGFAPAKSLIETVVAVDDSRDVHLFRVSPVSGMHYMENVCKAWSDALDNFHYYPVREPLRLVSKTSDAVNVLNILPETLKEPENFEYYIVGPPQFIEGAKRILMQKDVPVAQMHSCSVCMGLTL